MEYFAVLIASTAVIAALVLVLYRRRREIGIVVGVAALYYWTLYGAWYIVIDKTGGFSGKNYHYLEQKLFPIALDSNYMTALVLYAGFIIVAELTMMAGLSRRPRREIPPLTLRHEPILAIGFLAAAGSIYIMAGKLGAAWTLNVSAYHYTRTETGDWFTLHQVLNRVALLPPSIGLATLAAGTNSRFFVSVTRRYTLAAYLALFALMGTFTFILGNKNEILTALLTGFLTYMASARRPRLARVALVVGAGMWFLYTIDYFRGVPISRLAEVVSSDLDEATDVGGFITSSNEAYGAHFSMYGVLETATEPRFAYSIYSLACSVVPRILWKDRPRDIYLYYSESVGAIQNQGYSIHHATGWYLNFGYAGVGIGAVVLGLVWAYCLNAHQRIRARSGLLFRVFAVIVPWMFVANLPSLVRTGPEGYKGFVVDGILTPMTPLAFACRKRKRRIGPREWEKFAPLGALDFREVDTGDPFGIRDHSVPE
ncbi:MAG TPA: hypothetical protein VMG40_21505 [Bryobacteraceae bacterium]|nr:hypothetical protein [Bryobacteraceae bacterium]